MTQPGQDNPERPGRQARVVVIDLGRQKAFGAARRLRSMTEILEAAGAVVTVVNLLPAHASSWRKVTPNALKMIFSGQIVPETLAWSPGSVRVQLGEIDPDIVICTTARCFHPGILGPWTTYIDYVDRLSQNYRYRAKIGGIGFGLIGYSVLSRLHQRFESQEHLGVSGTFAAGRRDAADLHSSWIPNSVLSDSPGAPSSSGSLRRSFDLGFVGTLDYSPNVQALRELSDMWSEITRRVPEATALIAGARPTSKVKQLVVLNGWTLMPDFDDERSVYEQVRVAVAPVSYGTGLQNKVLDAALYGVPQVVSQRVSQGFDNNFPYIVCTTPGEWAQAIARLLEPNGDAQDLLSRAKLHATSYYSVEYLAGGMKALLGLQDKAL